MTSMIFFPKLPHTPAGNLRELRGQHKSNQVRGGGKGVDWCYFSTSQSIWSRISTMTWSRVVLCSWGGFPLYCHGSTFTAHNQPWHRIQIQYKYKNNTNTNIRYNNNIVAVEWCKHYNKKSYESQTREDNNNASIVCKVNHGRGWRVCEERLDWLKIYIAGVFWLGTDCTVSGDGVKLEIGLCCISVHPRKGWGTRNHIKIFSHPIAIFRLISSFCVTATTFQSQVNKKY